jgi:hypothetical protein
MRLRSAASFGVGVLCVSFWAHGAVRCQGSAAAPLSIVPPSSVTNQGSPPAAPCHSTGLNRWCSNPASPGAGSTANGSPPPAPEVPVDPPTVILASPSEAADAVSPPATTAKRSPPSAAKNVSPPTETGDGSPQTAFDKRWPPSATKNVSPPTAIDEAPAPTATARRPARSAVAKNAPPPADDEDAPAIGRVSPAGVDNPVPTPRVGKLSPSQEPGPDGLLGADYGVETSEPLSVKPRPAKQSKARPKPDIAERPSATPSSDELAGVEKLKPNLKICGGC